MDVFQYIKAEETTYQTIPVPIVEGYEWNMFEHVKLTSLYLNSQYETGNNDEKPFFNIVLAKINLQHRAVEFDVKDIVPYVDSSADYYKSFLVDKFHAKWAREADLSSTLNDMAEAFTDYGGVLVKNVDNAPEVVPFQRLAFCDQTDLMAGPICEKHYMSPDQLKEKEGEWDNVDELIALSRQGKENSQSNDQQTDTPTSYIDVYELHGVLPDEFLDDEAEEGKFSRQMHVVAFYKDENDKEQGITLFSGKENKEVYDAAVRDGIYGRALGRGGVEELFEAQVWTNYSIIRQKELLDSASKIVYQTADKAMATRQKITDLDNGEVLFHADGKPMSQVNTSPVNLPVFTASVDRWDAQAREISAAQEPISGEASKSGVPFRSQALSIQESKALHKYRKQKLGIFTRRLYKDWILPFISRELRKENEFMASLTLEELQNIAEQVVVGGVNKVIKERILSGKLITPEEIENARTQIREGFLKGGDKKFVKILKDELKDIPVDVDVLITGEQDNPAFVADQLSAVFGQVAQNPQILENPKMAKLFNEILDKSNLSPIQYGVISTPKAPQPQPQQPQGTPPLEVPQEAQPVTQ